MRLPIGPCYRWPRIPGSWEPTFPANRVNAAQAMTAAEVVDGKAELLSKCTTLRTFAPALLEALNFQGDRSVSSLLKAIDVLREMRRSDKRSLPANAPTAFVRPSWRRFVFQSGTVKRRAYEICVLSELRDRLRAGDVRRHRPTHSRSRSDPSIKSKGLSKTSLTD